MRNIINILNTVSLNRHGFKEQQMKPKHLKNYTDLAISTYDKAKYEYYGFQKKYSQPNQAIEVWLGVGFDYLFQRKIDDKELTMLRKFIERYKLAEEKVKTVGDLKARKEYDFINTSYIDAEGYICIRKLIPSPTCKNPKETARLQGLADVYEAFKNL